MDCFRLRYQVHPRWRGEYRLSTSGYASNVGSPPLARGILPQQVRRELMNRFTPAGAGNTHIAKEVLSCRQVHPRWRGEYKTALSLMTGGKGSPPLARGIPPRIPWLRSVARFTPAGAGNTPQGLEWQETVQVHPRWRGEYHLNLLYWRKNLGSPPLARGILILV